MDNSKRRRSSRLQKLQTDPVDDGPRSKSCGKGKNDATEMRASQSIGRRRTRSSSKGDSLSSTSGNKRTKVTTMPKSELSVSTNMNPSTTTTHRPQTRSLSKQIQMQAKSVTPSPLPAKSTTKFIFASPREATRRRRGSHETNDDESSRGECPPGVVNLYRDEDNSEQPSTKPDVRIRRARTRQGTQKQQNYSNHFGRPIVLSTGGYSPNSSTLESVTIDYIRSYGEDYWQSLHDSERPIIYDPSTLPSSNEMNNGKPCADAPKGANRKKRGIGSPSSRTSSSSSSTSKVTPNDKSEAWVPTDFNWIHEKKNLDPHHCQENTKTMSIQPQLTPKMRSILVDWLIELSEHFDFQPSTLHLAVTMVDRVLASGRFVEELKSSSIAEERRPRSRSVSVHDSYDSDSFDMNDDASYGDESDEDDESKDTRCYLIPRDRFQLLGATCVWLACKVQERNPPKAREIAYVSDHIYSIEQITRMERRICNALNFTFFEAPTPHQFLFEYMRASLAGCVPEQKLSAKNDFRFPIPAAATGVALATESVFRDMVHYLLELGRLPYRPTGRNPSLLAAAAVYLARVTLGIPRALKDASSSDSDSESFYWTPTLKYYTGYTQSDLRETVVDIHEYQMAAETSTLKAVFNKYKSKKYNRVALKTVVREEDLGFS